MSKVRRALGATVGAALFISGAGAVSAVAETREGTVTVSSGGYEVTARVVVSDRTVGVSYDTPVDIYVEHDGDSVSLDHGSVVVTDSAGQDLWAGDSGLTEIAEGHYRATPRIQNGTPIGDYTVSFVAFVGVDGARGPVLVRIGATDLVTFKVRYVSELKLVSRSSSLPTGATTTLAGTLMLRTRDAAGNYPRTPATGTLVEIAFDPEGSAARRTVGTAKVTSTGYFRLDTPVTATGIWYASYAGTETQHPVTAKTAQTARPHTHAIHQGSAGRTVNGAAAGIRVTTTDVVTTLTPQVVRVDFGLTTQSSLLSTSGLHLKGRRGEGKYPNGRYFGGTHKTNADSSAGYISVTMDGMTPPGVYDAGGLLVISSCTRPESSSGDCGRRQVEINDGTITTLTVKRATKTSISASSTSFTGARTVTLKGSVQKLQPVSATKAGYRASANTPVKLYWDPSGATGPQFKKTVYTNTSGAWTAKYRTSLSGRWIAEYPGAALSASSKSAVTITVK